MLRTFCYLIFKDVRTYPKVGDALPWSIFENPPNKGTEEKPELYSMEGQSYKLRSTQGPLKAFLYSQLFRILETGVDGEL